MDKLDIKQTIILSIFVALLLETFAFIREGVSSLARILGDQFGILNWYVWSIFLLIAWGFFFLIVCELNSSLFKIKEKEWVSFIKKCGWVLLGIGFLLLLIVLTTFASWGALKFS